MSGSSSSNGQARRPVLSQPTARAVLRRLAIADVALFVLTASTLWFFPTAFVIVIPIVAVIFVVGFVAAAVTAICLCPSTSRICSYWQAASMMCGYYVQPPDDRTT